MDDEKCFKLTGNNVVGNRYFYSTDPATAPSEVKFQCKSKFEPKMMIWTGMSSKGTPDHQSKQSVNLETMCRSKTIAPNIIRMEMICFGQSTLLKYCSRTLD